MVDVVLSCVDGQVNDIQVRFLIDSGTSECFISETLVEDNNRPRCRSRGKLKAHLAKDSLRSSNQCLSQVYVSLLNTLSLGFPCDKVTQV